MWQYDNTFPGRQNTDCSEISFSVKSKSSTMPSNLDMSIPTLKKKRDLLTSHTHVECVLKKQVKSRFVLH